MTFRLDREYLIEVERGNIAGASLTTKFGEGTVTTSSTVVTTAALWPMPSSAVSLEVVSSSANDTSAGSGARQVTLQGTDASFDEIEQTVSLNGTSAVAVPTDMTRINRMFVANSGTYVATPVAGSHAGAITLRASGGGATWGIIPSTPEFFGQSLIGAFCVPNGKTGYIVDFSIAVDASKPVDAKLWARRSADVASAPFGARRVVKYFVGLAGPTDLGLRAPIGPFVGPCDLYVTASVSVSTAEVSTVFDILVIDD